MAEPNSPSIAPRKLTRSRRSSWWAIVVAVVLIATGLVWARAHRVTPVAYTTAPVTRGTVAPTVTASGTVNPVVTVQVGSYVSGVIESVSCDYNTQVTKGQVCARIDPRPYQTIVDQDSANLAAARAQLAKDQTSQQYAQITYQRNADLAKRGIVSQDMVDQAKSVADQAKAQVDLDKTSISQHQAALEAAQVNLGYTSIVSPVDGTVVSRNITTGQTVAASFQTPTLFLIATDLTHMQVDTNVSEGDIGGITSGERATFTVEAFPDQTFEGSVAQVRQAPQTVQNVVTYDVVIGVSNPQNRLKPGMTATVHVITTEHDNVLRVPDQALRYTPGGIAGTGGGGNVTPVGTGGHDGETQKATVWVMRNGQAAAIPVTVGVDDGTNAEIVSGQLQPDDRVIVSERSTEGGQRGRPSGLRLRL
jgi:HlyD family secretion protein